MKRITIVLAFLSSIGIAQNFDINEYAIFLEQHQNLQYEELMELNPITHTYYKGIETTIPMEEYAYYDSILEKYELTDDELALLNQNHFVISERLSFSNMGHAFQDVWIKDMPVFVSTDAILHAIHKSYDEILIDIEKYFMLKNIDSALTLMYNYYPLIYNQYSSDEQLIQSLEDIDLYLTIANCLIKDSIIEPQLIDSSEVSRILSLIEAEGFVEMPLFSAKPRKLDFSQFTVRGHYVDDEFTQEYGVSLEPYFRAMMWLGRIDFWLTSPENDSISLADQLRMSLDALLLNEIVKASGAHDLIAQNSQIIDALVGESDNLTIEELTGICNSIYINDVSDILNENLFETFQDTLKKNNAYGQKIMSTILEVNIFSATPDTLPVSFKLMGQRFILDSYVFSNVVYDRIIYEEQKELRLMPDPLDVLYALGNNNAAPILEEEINRYHYSSQLSALRYLINSYEQDFWENSLYNTWLYAIKSLNTPEDISNYPLFMNTAAWQQEKMNTQLASWSQLRHDNLLYAKQSYTGFISCYYPHTYIEPIPGFYSSIKTFADKAYSLFNEFDLETTYAARIVYYFDYLSTVMEKLHIIAQKELNNESFTEEEIEFLKEVIYESEECGPEFNGWYPSIFYNMYSVSEADYIIADVHTQPTDSSGNVIGKVLHVGTGKINLGIFVAPSPSNDFKNTLFVGPVMSYYEKETWNFNRMTDQEWYTLVDQNDIPKRPDWVNIYLADENGNKYDSGRELQSEIYVNILEPTIANNEIDQIMIYPVPFSDELNAQFYLNNSTNIEISLINNLGQLEEIILNKNLDKGHYSIQKPVSKLNPGIYYLNIKTENSNQTIKIVK